MPVYFSTSRKPSQLTRRIVRRLAGLLQGKYENRGKRSGEEVSERAEQAGFSRVCFVYDKNGNPSAMQFFDLKEGWLKEEIRVLGVKEFEVERRAPKEVVVKTLDETGKKMVELLQVETSEIDGLEEEEAVAVEMKEGKIRLAVEGKPVLELRVKLEKHEKQAL